MLRNKFSFINITRILWKVASSLSTHCHKRELNHVTQQNFYTSSKAKCTCNIYALPLLLQVRQNWLHIGTKLPEPTVLNPLRLLKGLLLWADWVESTLSANLLAILRWMDIPSGFSTRFNKQGKQLLWYPVCFPRLYSPSKLGLHLK